MEKLKNEAPPSLPPKFHQHQKMLQWAISYAVINGRMMPKIVP
jgi:hypothetical protein